jgi:hypothetical protein
LMKKKVSVFHFSPLDLPWRPSFAARDRPATRPEGKHHPMLCILIIVNLEFHLHLYFLLFSFIGYIVTTLKF